MIYQLMYYSTARREFSERELQDLLEVARANNSRCGVTSLLLYGDGVFFQVLEGPETAVKSQFAKICEDSRHHAIVVAAERTVEQRSFGDWTMACMPFNQRERKNLLRLKRLVQEDGGLKHDDDSLIASLINSFVSTRGWQDHIAGD